VNNDLCNPEKFNIMLRSKSFEGESTPLVEEWYKTKYHVEPIPDSLMKKITSPSVQTNKKTLGLPPKNNFIPKNFDILAKDNQHS